jgi:hypothetical protein
MPRRAEEVRGRLDAGGLAVSAPSSDVDIGVLPPESVAMSVDRKVAIAAGLEDLLGVSRVDLVALPEPIRSSRPMSSAANACTPGMPAASTSTNCSCFAVPATSLPSSASGWR